MSIFCTGWWYRLSVPAFSLQIGGKERDMLWVQSMNSIRCRAEEIIKTELIYC